MSDALDEFERRILREMQRDASLSGQELADRIGLSPSACWRRVQRLRQDGHLVGTVAVVDPARLGFETLAFVQVRLDTHDRQAVSRFAAAIRSFEQVLECHALAGGMDFQLRVATRSMADLHAFIFERLQSLANVQKVHSSIALSQVKPPTPFPV